MRAGHAALRNALPLDLRREPAVGAVASAVGAVHVVQVRAADVVLRVVHDRLACARAVREATVHELIPCLAGLSAATRTVIDAPSMRRGSVVAGRTRQLVRSENPQAPGVMSIEPILHVLQWACGLQSVLGTAQWPHALQA